MEKGLVLFVVKSSLWKISASIQKAWQAILDGAKNAETGKRGSVTAPMQNIIEINAANQSANTISAGMPN